MLPRCFPADGCAAGEREPAGPRASAFVPARGWAGSPYGRAASARRRALVIRAARFYTGRHRNLPHMTPQQIARVLQDRFGSKITDALPENKHPSVHCDSENFRAIAELVFD